MKDRADGRRPPLCAALRRRHQVSRESSGDLAEAPAGSVFGSDSLNYIGRYRCAPSCRRVRRRSPVSGAPKVGK
jgi:hypothetical protein